MNVLAAERPVAPALTRYGSTAVAFHWAVAALIVFLGTLGLLFEAIPKSLEDELYHPHSRSRTGSRYI